MTTTNDELTINIISEEEGFDLLYRRSFSSLYCDMMSYCDTKSLNKLKKELGIDSKQRIKYVIAQSFHHKKFVCKQNKKITYKTPVCCIKGWEGSIEGDFGCTTLHPYGHIILALKSQKKKKESLET
jgi:hypothetical protein